MSLSSGDVAGEVVRLALTGTEITLRMAASATKSLAVMTMALAKHQRQLSGKINMRKMLKGNRDIRVFTMSPQQYRKFKKKAKKYRILYSVVKDKDGKGRSIDVLMPATELERANAIFERIDYGREQSEPQPQKTKEKEEKSKNVHRSVPGSKDTKAKPNSSRQDTDLTMAAQAVKSGKPSKPSIEAKLEGYRQQQSASRGPTKTQRKRRGASTKTLEK